MKILTILDKLFLLLFFPTGICLLLSIVVIETIIQPIWERSAVYMRTFPKNMYIIFVLALIAWLVSWIYGEELPKSALMSFLEGSSMSILAAVIFYFFTNHISNIDNRKSAYDAHYDELRGLTEGCLIESKLFGQHPDRPKDIEEKASNFLNPYNGETRFDGLAETFIPFLQTLDYTCENFRAKRASMSRIDRSVNYFDQDVRNAFTKIEDSVDTLLIDFEKYRASYGRRKDATAPEQDSIELMYFIRTATSFARLTLSRMELKKALKKST
ncbi:hypothetical protein A165_02750 [Vibrio tasmaniensis ZS-17]|uniref:hypothetical protein n=1 Tax=Vibrio TaxID=662 RepID=UPI0002FD687F|nr:hypothetical protein [Vibrio tasmaniensis]OED68608.1 hypothetical protein A165_02750 [Vibrio tasmaniensis ZS-17]